MPDDKETKPTGAPKAEDVNKPTEPANPLAPDPTPAAADEPAPKGKDAPKHVVYLGGDAYPPPSNDPSGLWSQQEWQDRDKEAGFFRVDEHGKLIDD